MNKLKINNQGFGKKEMMMALFIIIVALAFFLYKVLGPGSTTQFTQFKRQADTFHSNASKLRDMEGEYPEIIYLYDVIIENYSESIKNPFNGNEECDVYESKLEKKDNKSYLTFKCGEYLIYEHYTLEDKYTIYKVSEWTEQKLTGDNVQAVTFYNYEVNGEEQFPNYHIEKEFLVKYSEKTGLKTRQVSYIGTSHKLLQKTYYRTVEKVK